MKCRGCCVLIVVVTLAAPIVLAVSDEAGRAPQARPESASAEPQPPPVTFRAEANFVEVDAFVSDGMGNPATDLRATDFEVLEDGKPQKVSAFSLVNIPVIRTERPLFSPSAIEPDVQTNLGMDGRIYLFVLDDLHVDIARAVRVKNSLHRFFERNFGANDVGAVVFTSGRAADGQDFTNNPRLLLAAVDKLFGRKQRSATLERLDEYNRLQTGGLRRSGDPVNDPLAMERGRDARNTMQSLQKLSDFMAGVHGRRKAMVLISEGIDYDIYDLFGNNSVASDIVDATRNAIAAATRANVSIYAIDPRGLTVAGADLIETSGVAADEPGLGLGVASSLNELRLSQDSLRSLADETGGFAVTNQNDVNAAFDRLVTDNSTYYVIGYYPTNDKRDGKFRRIEVRLTRPGLTVRARRGYVAPRGRAAPARAARDMIEDSLGAAVDSPLAMSGIPMRLFAAPYKGTAPNAAVAVTVELGVGGLKFTQQNGTFNDKLAVVVRVLDSDAKVRVNEKADLDLTLMPATLARAQAAGFRVTSAVNLPPGRYQVRVSAADSGGGSGSVVGDLDVPDFFKMPLAMSGLTLISAAASVAPTARVKEDPVGLLLMQPATTAREFSRDDQLTLFAEVYENQRNVPPHKVAIAAEVRAEGGRVVFGNHEERSSAELQDSSTGAAASGAGRGGYGYTVQIPLKDFPSGLYVVHVEASSFGGRDQTRVARDVQIRIR
jgi:VWFA-related protein